MSNGESLLLIKSEQNFFSVQTKEKRIVFFPPQPTPPSLNESVKSPLLKLYFKLSF